MKMSEVSSFLEYAYDIFNNKYFEGTLPKVVISIMTSKRAYGHFTTYKPWSDREGSYYEINLSAEYLSRPIYSTLATLIHEQVHCYCRENNLAETSRMGQYHNKIFKEQAENRGLIIGYDKRIGYSITSPSQELIDFIDSQGWGDIDLSRSSGFSFGGSGGSSGKGGEDPNGSVGGVDKPKSHIRKYQCNSCGCSCRASKEIRIMCLDCFEPMELAI